MPQEVEIEMQVLEVGGEQEEEQQEEEEQASRVCRRESSTDDDDGSAKRSSKHKPWLCILCWCFKPLEEDKFVEIALKEMSTQNYCLRGVAGLSRNRLYLKSSSTVRKWKFYPSADDVEIGKFQIYDGEKCMRVNRRGNAIRLGNYSSALKARYQFKKAHKGLSEGYYIQHVATGLYLYLKPNEDRIRLTNELSASVSWDLD